MMTRQLRNAARQLLDDLRRADPDADIRWWIAWQDARSCLDCSTRELAEYFHDCPAKPRKKMTDRQVVAHLADLMDYGEENIAEGVTEVRRWVFEFFEVRDSPARGARKRGK